MRFLVNVVEAELRLIAIEVGADLRFGHELVSFAEDDDGVLATIHERSSDREHSLRAQFLVAADGVRGRCREGLG